MFAFRRLMLFGLTFTLLFVAGFVSVSTVMTKVNPANSVAHATTSSTINFQARLLQASGAVAPDGTYNVQFNLYTTSSGGSTLWTESYLNSASQGLVTTNGYLSTSLGSITAFPSTIPWDQDLWIGMTVRGTGSCAFGACTPTDGEMTPRMKVTASPYAFAAGKLQATDTSTTNSLVFATPSGSNKTLTLPNETGTVCTNAAGGVCSALGSYIQNGTSLQSTANFNIQSAAAGSVGGIIRGATSQTADLLQLQSSAGTNLFSVGATGAILSKNSTNSTAALNVQNVAGDSLLKVDTTNGRVVIGDDPGLTGAKARLYFGDPGNDILWIGEQNTTDTDIMQIQGRNGLRFTTSGAPTEVVMISGTGAATFKNISNSTTAFQVQNAAGTTFINADSTNQQLSVRNKTDAAVLGSALTPITCSGTNWTGTNPYTHTIGSTSALSCSSPSIVASTTYQIDYTTTGTAGGETFRLAIGGVNGGYVYGNVTNDTQTITTTGTGNFTITPTSSATGSITINSIKIITNNTSAFAIKDSSGTIRLEVRAVDSNTALGLYSLQSNTTGGGNSAFGSQSLQSNTSGGANTANGNFALQSNTTGFYNTANGYSALQNNTTGGDNTATGNNALKSNTTGFYNTANGSHALEFNTIGTDNTATGYYSLKNNTTGIENVAIGSYSLLDNVTGYDNTSVGTYSLQNNTSGYNNTALGLSALNNNTVGGENTAIGFQSLDSNLNGNFNTAIGNTALQANVSGSNNIALGNRSLYYNVSGSYNTAVGTSDEGASTLNQFKSLENLSYTTGLGAFAQVYQNNVLSLGGQGSATETVKVGIGTGLPTNQLSAESYRYNTGTVTTTSGSGTVTGSGTSWLTNASIGNLIYISTNSTTVAPYVGTITAVTDDTHITVTPVMPVANVVSGAQYYINYAGLQLTSNGLLGIGTINPTATLQVAGNVLFKDLVNSSTAFQVQNAAGTSILNVNTSTAQLTATGTLLVNNTTANDDQIQLSVTTGGAGKFTGIITNADLTANRTYTLPNESGTFCTTGSVCSGYAPSAASGYIQLAPSSAQGDTTTNNSIFINKTGATGDIINLQDSGTSVFRVKQGGDVSVGSSSAYGFTVNGRSFGLNGTLSASNGSFILDQTIANVDPFASFQNSGKFDLTTATADPGDMYGLYNATDITVQSGTYNLSNAIAFRSEMDNSGGETIANRYAIQATQGSNAGTITNDYGVYVGNMNATSGTTNDYPLYLAGASNAILRINGNGDTIFRNQADGTTAFQVQNTAGTSQFTIDTTNSNITVGSTTASSGSTTIDANKTGYALTVNNASTATSAGAPGSSADGILIKIGTANASRTTGNYFAAFSDGSTVAGKIQGGASAVAYTTTAADYAEYFKSDPNNLPQAGQIVMTDTSNNQSVLKSGASTDKLLVGIVSTNPGFIGNGPLCNIDDDNCETNYAKYNSLVALSGQVPAKVNTTNGPIAIGDPITASSVVGEGSKATSTSYIVGYAQEALASGSGTINVLVRPQYYTPNVQNILQAVSLNITGETQLQGDTSITGNLNASGATTLNTLAVVGNATFGGDVSVSGNLTTATLTVNGHIVTGGNVPTVTISSAVDSNLNIAATIEGNDSAGTITITTPENLATQVVNTKLLDIVFNKEFGSKPKVITSAEGSDSATLVTYVETAKDNFKLGIINSLQPGKTYKLNYFVVQ